MSLREEEEEKPKKTKKKKNLEEQITNNSIFLYRYKFSENLEERKECLYEMNETKGKMVIDSSLKEEKSRIIIKNLLNKLLDLENLQRFLFEEKNKSEISWSIVADKIKFYSVDDLKNQWNKTLKDLNLEKKCMLIQDLKMIN